MSLINHLTAIINDDESYFDPEFQRMCVDNIDFIRSTSDQKYRVISDYENSRYAGNFTALLLAVGIERRYFHIVMMINKVVNPQTYDGSLQTIEFPNTNNVDILHSLYTAKKI